MKKEKKIETKSCLNKNTPISTWYTEENLGKIK